MELTRSGVEGSVVASGDQMRSDDDEEPSGA
jgi:hypothetical protein